MVQRQPVLMASTLLGVAGPLAVYMAGTENGFVNTNDRGYGVPNIRKNVGPTPKGLCVGAGRVRCVALYVGSGCVDPHICLESTAVLTPAPFYSPLQSPSHRPWSD